MRHLKLLALFAMSSAAHAEEWVAIPDSQSQEPSSSPKASVDTQSIEVLDAGLRRATVKLDFSLRPRDPADTPASTLKLWILVTLYDCAKHASRVESSQSILGDGTVKSAKATNTETWLQTEIDPGRDFVCAWKPK
jgi:hypothetical protein